MNPRILIKFFLLMLIAVPVWGTTGKICCTVLRAASVTLPERTNTMYLAVRTPGGYPDQNVVNDTDTNQLSVLAKLKSEILRANRYQVSMAVIDPVMRAKEKMEVLPPLSWDEVGRLVHFDTTALLIVLEGFEQSEQADYAIEHRIWRVYDYATKTVLDEFDHKYRYRFVTRTTQGYSYLPSRAIEIYAGHLLPHWEYVERDYYRSGNRVMKAATDSIEDGSWEGATFLWLMVVGDSSRHRKLAAQASYNMAVYYELNNNFEKALEWISRSQRMGNTMAIWYAKIIRVRASENSVLQEQLAVNQGQLPAPVAEKTVTYREPKNKLGAPEPVRVPYDISEARRKAGVPVMTDPH